MNSVSVDLTFTEPAFARDFYFDSPGEGFASQHKVHKCVEGNKKLAQRLERMARRARGVTTINVNEYDVETR